jgi:hypothetical protein
MRLFGQDWDRASLLRRVGDIRQIGGAQPVVLDDGPERGVRAIEVRTGTGFVFWVLPDRGLDLWRVEHQGAPLAWCSPTGPVHPAFFEPEGLGWLRGFAGGGLVTCGLTYLGAPTRDQGKELGLHGRASYAPAFDVGIEQGWDPEDPDDYPMTVRGKIREASVFGENVVLSRRIRSGLGESGFDLLDTVENRGHEPVPHTLLYHVNAGFPVVAEGAELLVPSQEVRGADERAEREKAEHARFGPPQAGYAERCYFHRIRSHPNTMSVVALVNRRFNEGRGLGYALRFDPGTLPCFTEWKMTGQGLYVVGTEPGNVFPEPRDRMRSEGRLPVLEPGEKREYVLRFEVLASGDEIREVENEIRSL